MSVARVCYLEIPSSDSSISSAFYSAVFGWKIRRRGDGLDAFDDGGEVSGVFQPNREPQGEGGIAVYIMVGDAASAVERIVGGGGEIVRPIESGSEVTALFRDPTGNVLGVYQSPE